MLLGFDRPKAEEVKKYLVWKMTLISDQNPRGQAGECRPTPTLTGSPEFSASVPGLRSDTSPSDGT